MKYKTKLSIGILILVIVFSIIIYFVQNGKLDTKSLDIISLLGNSTSILGLFFVLFQLYSIKEISEASNTAVINTENAIYKITSIIDITKTIKEISEIQHYNREEKFELTLSRIPELKETLHLIKSNPNYSPHIDNDEFQNQIIEISVDRTNLERFLKNKIKTIDVIRLNSNLEDILDSLHRLQPVIRYREPIK